MFSNDEGLEKANDETRKRKAESKKNKDCFYLDIFTVIFYQLRTNIKMPTVFR